MTMTKCRSCCHCWSELVVVTEKGVLEGPHSRDFGAALRFLGRRKAKHTLRGLALFAKDERYDGRC